MHPVEINAHAALDRLLDDPASPDDAARGLRRLDAAFAPSPERLDAIREAVMGADAAPHSVIAETAAATPTDVGFAPDGGRPVIDHRGRPSARRGWLAAAAVLALALGLAGFFSGSGGRRSHDTPISAPHAALAFALSGTPQPSECTVAPQLASAMDPYLTAASTPITTPDGGLASNARILPANGITVRTRPTGAVLIGGAPADPRVVGEIDRTAREIVACENAGDLLRLASLVSGQAGTLYFHLPADNPAGVATVQASFLQPATPRAAAGWGTVAPVVEARLLDDGRAVALVFFDAPRVIDRQTNFVPMLFRHQGARWVLDEVVDVPADWRTPDVGSASSSPISVAPTSCDVTPRTSEELARIVANVTPAPMNANGTSVNDRSGLVVVLRPKAIDGQFVLTGGAEPDDQTLGGVTAQFSHAAACADERDGLRYLALVSDRFIVRLASEDPKFLADSLAKVLSTPQPGNIVQRLVGIDLAQPRLLSDGRVAVIYLPQIVTSSDFTYAPPATPEGTITSPGAVMILVFENGRWLLDDQIGPRDLRVASVTEPQGTPATPPTAAQLRVTSDAPDPRIWRATPTTCDTTTQPQTVGQATAVADPPAVSRVGGVPVQGRNMLAVILAPRAVDGQLAITGGSPSDDSSIVGIAGTFGRLLACANAGDRMGLRALYTDAYLREHGPGDRTVGTIEAAVSTPLSGAAAWMSLSFSQPRMLADGRVAVILSAPDGAGRSDDFAYESPPSIPGTVAPAGPVYVLSLVDGRWRIDDIVDPSDVRVPIGPNITLATPTP